MLCSGRGALARRLSRHLTALRLIAAMAAAIAAIPAAAHAQTTVVLDVPNSQVIDTTIRNGPYAGHEPEQRS